MTASIAWSLIVALLIAGRLAFIDGAVPASAYGAWGFLAIAPLVVGLMILRGRSNRSIGHVLYDAEHATAAARKRP